MPRAIPLTRGESALVDDSDYDWLRQWRWLLVGPGYAGRFDRLDGTSRLIYMHRLLINAQPGQHVDHINGDRLDNRRANLRLVTNTQNQQNKRTPSHNTSGHKGVCWHKGSGKWHVRITVNGKRLHLGYTRDRETAARLYDAAARRFFGEYAHLNYPDSPTSPRIAGLLADILARHAVTRLPVPSTPLQCRRTAHE